jgi:hypothetical protein
MTTSILRLDDRRVGLGDASVRLDRAGDEVAVSEPAGDDASLRALLDAVAGAANTRRLVGNDDVLGRCGFERDGDRWVRELRPEVDETPFVTLVELEEAIRSSWGRDTTEEPDVWSEDNPGWGNCVVTALVVRDYLGGDVVVSGVVRDGARVDRHAFNRLPGGLFVDLSRDQFRHGEQFEAPEVVDRFLSSTTPERYEILAARVREKLNIPSTP